jgi:membrane protease YdiL (CAAX protease family)
VTENERRSPTACPVDAPVGIAYFLAVWVAGSFAQAIVLVAFGPDDGEVAIGVLALALGVGWTVFLVGTWVTSRHAGSGDVRRDFGIEFVPLDLVGIPLGVAAQLAAVPALYAPLRAIWPDTFSDAALSETAEDLVGRARSSSDLMLAVLSLIVVVGAPVVEEIAYRGLLQRPLIERFHPAIVIPGVAVTFALIHFRPVEYPGLLLAGLLFGACAWRTRRLGMAIAAHVGFNAAGLVLAL